MKVSPCNGFLKDTGVAEASEFEGAEDADAATNLTDFKFPFFSAALGDLEFFRLAPATPATPETPATPGWGVGFALTLGLVVRLAGIAFAFGFPGIALCFGFRLFLGFWTETPETPESSPSGTTTTGIGAGTLVGTTGGAPDAGAEGGCGGGA